MIRVTAIVLVCFAIVFSGKVSADILAKDITADSSTLKSITISNYCGECNKRCGDLYTIDKMGIAIDTSQYAYFKSAKGVVSPFVITTPIADSYMRKLVQAYPKSFLFESKVYGHPDSHDQCGVYIAFNFPTKVIEINIDTDDYSYQDSKTLPKDVIAFRYTITDMIKEIQEKFLLKP